MEALTEISDIVVCGNSDGMVYIATSVISVSSNRSTPINSVGDCVLCNDSIGLLRRTPSEHYCS